MARDRRRDASVSMLKPALAAAQHTAFRLVQTLQDRGYVQQDPITKRYSLPPDVLDLRTAGLMALRFPRVGSRLPANPTSMGKVLRAAARLDWPADAPVLLDGASSARPVRRACEHAGAVRSDDSPSNGSGASSARNQRDVDPRLGAPESPSRSPSTTRRARRACFKTASASTGRPARHGAPSAGRRVTRPTTVPGETH